MESPESNGMAEAFVKTFKRDYIRINQLPDGRTALARIDHCMESSVKKAHLRALGVSGVRASPSE